MSQAAQLLDRCDGVRKSGDGWVAKCPAHKDRTPSFSVKETDDGTVLVHCFAGCSVHDITSAVGLDVSDLFPPEQSEGGPLPARQRHVSRAMLNTLTREALVTATAADQLAKGETLTDDDRERIREANRRLRDAARQMGAEE